jgi:hypothetical protein
MLASVPPPQSELRLTLVPPARDVPCSNLLLKAEPEPTGSGASRRGLGHGDVSATP